MKVYASVIHDLHRFPFLYQALLIAKIPNYVPGGAWLKRESSTYGHVCHSQRTFFRTNSQFRADENFKVAPQMQTYLYYMTMVKQARRENVFLYWRKKYESLYGKKATTNWCNYSNQLTLLFINSHFFNCLLAFWVLYWI